MFRKHQLLLARKKRKRARTVMMNNHRLIITQKYINNFAQILFMLSRMLLVCCSSLHKCDIGHTRLKCERLIGERVYCYCLGIFGVLQAYISCLFLITQTGDSFGELHSESQATTRAILRFEFSSIYIHGLPYY